MVSAGADYLVQGGCVSSQKDTGHYIEGWRVDPLVNATWVYESEGYLKGSAVFLLFCSVTDSS